MPWCKWESANSTSFYNITTAFYVSCTFLPFMCSWFYLRGGVQKKIWESKFTPLILKCCSWERSHWEDYNGIYRISSKYRHTSKSRCPRNVAACFCELIPINAALEMSPHGKGSPAIIYTHTRIIPAYITEAVRVDLGRRRPRIVTAPSWALK